MIVKRIINIVLHLPTMIALGIVFVICFILDSPKNLYFIFKKIYEEIIIDVYYSTKRILIYSIKGIYSTQKIHFKQSFLFSIIAYTILFIISYLKWR